VAGGDDVDDGDSLDDDEWSEDPYDYSPEPPPTEFGADTAEREAALIALGAAALARRAFPGGPYAVDPLRREIVLALALNAPDHPDLGDTDKGLAALLGVQHADVIDALDVLRAEGLARPEPYPSAGKPVAWELTGSGREAALEFARHAARFVYRRRRRRRD
jgi:hypothetical protein